jgi:hypothetical protein
MNDIAIIDIEASGLHFDAYPIEVAVLLGGVSRSWLIRPEPYWKYWCATAQSMHGISRSELLIHGLSASRVVKELDEFICNYEGVVYSDAEHWDTDWIDTLYYAVDQPRHFIIGSVYDYLDAEKAVIFDQHKAHLAQSGHYRHHRAQSDVNMIAEALRLTLSP